MAPPLLLQAILLLLQMAQDMWCLSAPPPPGFQLFGPHGYPAATQASSPNHFFPHAASLPGPQFLMNGAAQPPMQPVNVTYSIAACSPAPGPMSSSLTHSPASPYHHFPAPAAKRGPGRPRSSKNKRHSSEEDSPPAQGTRRTSSFRAVSIPEVHEWDFEIATQETAACSKCALNKAMFLCMPCSHYGLCLECLQRHESKCEDSDSPVVCMGCNKSVSEFIKYFRASLTN